MSYTLFERTLPLRLNSIITTIKKLTIRGFRVEILTVCRKSSSKGNKFQILTTTNML